MRIASHFGCVFRVKTENEVASVLSGGGCPENRLLIVPQFGQPMIDVADMIGEFGGDIERDADECRTYLGNEFFIGIFG